MTRWQYVALGLTIWTLAIAAIAYWVRAAHDRRDSVDPDWFYRP